MKLENGLEKRQRSNRSIETKISTRTSIMAPETITIIVAAISLATRMMGSAVYA
ncbi:MAG TPA: hypothetical protein VFY41_02370 [Nitrososphaeraceae archaeon]|nr:hypothetical protein [Nitrososphaeraceae archaeon]